MWTKAGAAMPLGVVAVVMLALLAPITGVQAGQSFDSFESALKGLKLSSLAQLMASLPAGDFIVDPQVAATAFLPTDKAFEKLSKSINVPFEKLLTHKTWIEQLPMYHTVPGKSLKSGNLKSSQVLPTLLAAKSLTVKNSPKTGITVVAAKSTAKVVVADVVIGKLVVHVVDTVLLPAPVPDYIRVPLPKLSEIRSQFAKWNASLQTGDAEAVAALYAADAVLLPTVSSIMRTTSEGIADYFHHFLQKKPWGVVTDSQVRVYSHTLAGHYGDYTFHLTDPVTGVHSTLAARFSYTYRKDSKTGKWLIVEHHSSAVPVDNSNVSVAEVQAQFTLWNATLQSGDAAAVAALYAEDAVLLPTLSNVVRDTPAAVENYFEHFLLKKPWAVVDEIHTAIYSSTLSAIQGIYSFHLTDPITGAASIAQARFSFTYRKDNNVWKIVEHHSSLMPEATTTTTHRRLVSNSIKGTELFVNGGWWQ